MEQEVALVQILQPKGHFWHALLLMKYSGTHWVQTTESKHVRQSTPAGFAASINEVEVLVVGKALLVGGQDECQHEKSSC